MMLTKDKKNLNVIGLMSGTSVDAIDVSICNIKIIGDSKIAEELKYEIKEIAFEKVEWSEKGRELIFQCFNTDQKIQSTTSIVKLISEVNFMIGREFANAVIQVCNKHSIPLKDIDLIGSHGQTIWHNINNENGKTTDTLQLGDISVISNLTSITTIGDFRTADVSTQGSGAPFAGIFDLLILSSNEYNQAIQNIGGIGNVTFLPKTTNNNPESKAISFDTGPGNVMIDYLISKITNGKLKYDDKGALARTGRILKSPLEGMMQSDYFKIKPPKSTGRELFSFEFSNKWYDICREDKYYQNDQDILCTFTEFTALSIAKSYYDFSPFSENKDLDRVIIAGGGSYNDYLLERIEWNCRKLFNRDSIQVIKHDDIGFSSESKESLLFALLASLNINSININLKYLTGNQSPNGIKLGKLSPGNNILNLIQ